MCRALLCDQAEDQLETAWKVLLPKGANALDGAAFRQVLPLLGEEVPESQVPPAAAELLHTDGVRQIDQLFAEADGDSSGMIEYSEFCKLVSQLVTSSLGADCAGRFGL